METDTQLRNPLSPILEEFPDRGRSSLIPLLQRVQEVNSYLSEESMVRVAEYLQLPLSKVYGVATFYNQFRFAPVGKYQIQLCRGTACHVEGSLTLLEALKNELKIGPQETTKDGLFSLEVVACIGACGLAPVISINGEFYAKISVGKIKEILQTYRDLENKHESN